MAGFSEKCSIEGVRVPTLDIDVQKFTGVYAPMNGLQQLQVSRRKCLKFAISVGNSHYSRAFGSSKTAVALAAYRASAVRCVLDFNQPTLQPFSHYSQLESSEKVSLSYWIGMTVAAIAAADLLEVPRLTHATQQHGLVKVSKKSKSLADLVGQDGASDWHVIEAKARQSAPSATRAAAWKAQAQTVAAINGKSISTSSYCLGLIATTLTAELVDPPSGGQLDLQIAPDALGTRYYEGFVDLLGAAPQTVTRGNRSFVVRPMTTDPIDNEVIWVGLDEELYKALRNNQAIPAALPEYEDDAVYAGTDGIVIATDSLSP